MTFPAGVGKNSSTLYKSDGTEAGTATAPLRTDPVGTTTQPVSGTVTATQGTAAAAAGAWPTKITDGTSTAAVKAASTAAVATDPALVVTISPNNAITATTVAAKITTETESNVASSATAVTLLAANSARIGAVIVNDSTQVLYVKFGSGASSTSYRYRLPPLWTLEFPNPMYTGIVTGIWVSADGSARVSEAV